MLASTESQRRIIVHAVRGVEGLALAFATQASAWQGVAGAQSESWVHASSETTGLHNAQPQSGNTGRESSAGRKLASLPPSELASPSSEGAAVLTEGGAETGAAAGAAGVSTHPAPNSVTATSAAPTNKAAAGAAVVKRAPGERGLRGRMVAPGYSMPGGAPHLYTAGSGAQNGAMSDDNKKDVFSEVSDSLGSLFKRAKAAVEHVPTAKIEEAVKASAHRVEEAAKASAHKVEEVAKHAAEKVPMAAFEGVVRSGARVVETAAKTAASKVDTHRIEEVMTSGVREVGRAFENVANTLQREMLGSTPDTAHTHPEPPAEPEAEAPKDAPSSPPAHADAGAPDVIDVEGHLVAETEVPTDTPAIAAPAAEPVAAAPAPVATAPAPAVEPVSASSKPSSENPHEGI